MRPSAPNESGESLVEILISLVIMGIVVSAFFAVIATTSKATTTNRDSVRADGILRSYAETAKQAVRDTCTSGNTGASVTVSYTPPPGWSSPTATGLTCPAPTSVNQVDITAPLPNGTQKLLSIDVRTSR